MADNENSFSSLVSIIKIEPEEFQTSEERLTLNSDDVLRLKAKIFSDPTVFVERLRLKTSTIKISKRGGIKKKQQSYDPVSELARKSNAGKSSSDPHTCSLCKKVLRNRQTLKKHLMSFHGQGPKLFCDLCPKTFRVKSQIARHVKSHTKKTFACNICDFKTFRKGILEQHKKIHLKEEKCKICNKQVASQKHHLLSHKKEPCPVCGKMFSIFNMKQHMKVHDDSRCKCSDCNFSAFNKEMLRRHKLENHYNGKVYRCHCGSVYKSTGGLSFHQLSHESKKVTCKVCERKFAHDRYLKRHWKRKHSKTYGSLVGSKVVNLFGMFICDKCGAKLNGRKSLISHLRLNHSTKPPFACDLCPKTFNRKDLLADHMHSQHFNINPFACKVCGYKNTSKRNLRRHMLQHEPKTECKICYKMVTNMNRHMRYHVKQKCPVCAKILSIDGLRNHVRKIHKENI